MKKVLIGIDPDTDKSGFALIFGKTILLKNLKFFELFKMLYFIKNHQEYQDCDMMVYVECGFLNGGNRHFKAAASTAFNGKISERVGANHEIAKKVCEMCEFLKLPFQQIRPTKSKTDSDFFKKLTKIKTRTNQEQRDAMMMIWGLQNI